MAPWLATQIIYIKNFSQSNQSSFIYYISVHNKYVALWTEVQYMNEYVNATGCLNTIIITLISSFLSQGKSRFSVEGELSTSRDIQAGVPQGSALTPHIAEYIYKLYAPSTWYLSRSLYWWHTYNVYATDRTEGCVLRKLQRGLSALETWCERWNIKFNEDKRLRPSAFLIDFGLLRHILHWMDGISPSSVV
jgi:hypothetical protein